MYQITFNRKEITTILGALGYVGGNKALIDRITGDMAKQDQASKEIDFTRINNDANGNPRHVCHYLTFITDLDGYEDNAGNKIDRYALALSRAKKLFGRKYHNKQYGGGIVFIEYPSVLQEQIVSLMAEVRTKQVEDIAKATNQMIADYKPQSRH